MAREHAARRIQWAHRCLRLRNVLRQLLCAHGTASAQLESWKEARKTERKAVKARARAGCVRLSQSCTDRETTAHAGVAEVEKEEWASGVGEKFNLTTLYTVAIGALFATASTLSSPPGPYLTSSPLGVHRLSGSLGDHHEERNIPNEVDSRLRWLWLQASHTTEPGGPRNASRNDCHGEARDYAGRDISVLYLDMAQFFPANQPVALCEALRLAGGAWALPRPPESGTRASWWATKFMRQEREESVRAVDVDERCSASVRLQTGGLIVGELVGRCQGVSRWPEHMAASCGWRKGHPDFVHPDVVLAASTSSGRVRRSGQPERATTIEQDSGKVAVEAIRRSLPASTSLSD